MRDELRLRANSLYDDLDALAPRTPTEVSAVQAISHVMWAIERARQEIGVPYAVRDAGLDMLPAVSDYNTHILLPLVRDMLAVVEDIAHIAAKVDSDDASFEQFLVPVDRERLRARVCLEAVDVIERQNAPDALPDMQDVRDLLSWSEKDLSTALMSIELGLRQPGTDGRVGDIAQILGAQLLLVSTAGRLLAIGVHLLYGCREAP